MGDITEKNLPKFKAQYQLALDQHKESFMFEGHEVLVAYAKYVIEYFIMTKGVTCLRCGYNWIPRGNLYPKNCAACHVANWDKPPKRPKKEGGGK